MTTLTQAVRSSATTGEKPARAKRVKLETRRALPAYYWMVWPAVIAFAAFHTVPVLVGIFFSFTNYAGYGEWNFVGLSNYVNLFKDDRVLAAYGFSFLFAIVATILTNVISLAIALGLNAKIKARNFWRGVYFVPYVLAILVIGYVFQFLFSNSLPKILAGIPLFADNILTNPDWAWTAIVALAVWQSCAFAIIIYLSGLQTIPAELYEAASLDGAKPWRQFIVDHLPAHQRVLHDQRGAEPEGLPAGVRPGRRPHERRPRHLDGVGDAADLPRRVHGRRVRLPDGQRGDLLHRDHDRLALPIPGPSAQRGRFLMTTALTTAAQAEEVLPIAPPRRRRGKEDDDTRRTNWWATALIAVLSLTILIPMYLAVVVALKTPDQLVSGTGFEWPNPVRWENFPEAWERTNFPQALANTALITVGSVVFTLLTSSIVAYALARNIHRPFFKGVFFYLLAALFIPFPIIMLPLVKQTAILGLDNQAGMIVLYTIYGLSINVFIYTAYIRSIPIELEEAARDRRREHLAGVPVGDLPVADADERDRRHPHVRVGVERLHHAARGADRSGRAHASAGAVRVPGPVQHRLHGGLRVVPDGDGSAPDRVHLLAALGHLRRHAGLDQVSAARAAS